MMSREVCDVVFLDCRKLGGQNVVSFLNKLSGACKSIHSRRKGRKDFSLYCHMMYAWSTGRTKSYHNNPL